MITHMLGQHHSPIC